MSDAEQQAAAAAEAERLQQQKGILNQAYIDNFGRPIGSVGWDFYNKEIDNNRKTMAQVLADLSWDQNPEGMLYTSPAEQAAIDAAAAANAQNSANLGFGASSVSGNAFDDDAQIKAMNELLEKNQATRLNIVGPRTDYDNDLMNVFRGAEEYRQGFVNDLSGLLGSLTGQSTLNTNIPVTDLSTSVNTNNNALDQFVNFDTLDRRIKDYENKFVSPY